MLIIIITFNYKKQHPGTGYLISINQCDLHDSPLKLELSLSSILHQAKPRCRVFESLPKPTAAEGRPESTWLTIRLPSSETGRIRRSVHLAGVQGT